MTYIVLALLVSIWPALIVLDICERSAKAAERREHEGRRA